ncbi:MAG: tyrosine--tRNA ligase [Candidatus Omnitrophota bacterium]
MKAHPVDSILKMLTRGTTEVINIEAFEEKLRKSKKNGKPLRIKAGFDPTAPDIHLGHVVLLNKLRQFQDAGHVVYFLIGDFTAQIGDPSGRDQLRPKMTTQQIAQNAKSYKKQVFKILDKRKTKVVFNSAWLSQLTAQDILALAARATVAQMLARADFKKRYEQKKEISILEFIYPLLQGYDSVYLKADVELGGSDQKFNLLMGRQLQESFGQDPQVVLMTPLLEGTDGIQKMSKSLGNYIGIEENPKDIFGKTMSIDDSLMAKYYELLTDVNLNGVKAMHPKEAKLQLGQILVERFYGSQEAAYQRSEFDKTFGQKQTPEDMAEFTWTGPKAPSLMDAMIQAKLVGSKNEARRLIKQGAVSHNNKKISSENWELKEGVLKVGKRRFLKLMGAPPNLL